MAAGQAVPPAPPPAAGSASMEAFVLLTATAPANQDTTETDVNTVGHREETAL